MIGDLLAVLAGGARDRADGMMVVYGRRRTRRSPGVLRLGLERTTLPSRGRRGPSTGSRACRHFGELLTDRRRRLRPESDRGTGLDVTRPSAVPPPWRMARQLPILCPCLQHGIETVPCPSSCSLGSSRSRWEAMRHGPPWREVMG